jgi:hypothetical protein
MQWEPSCSMRTDRQTDMTKLIVAVRNFANAPENEVIAVSHEIRRHDGVWGNRCTRACVRMSIALRLRNSLCLDYRICLCAVRIV